MDGFSIHPYPDPENRAPDRASDWPQVNMADLHRIKQAISDAFAGTPQKTIEGGLPLHIDEIAYQVPTEGKPGYTGSEAASVNLVSEQEQAEFYAKLVNMAACDPQIASLNFFHFIDEKSRVGFQSGFLDLAKTERPVVSAVRNAIAATNGGSKCVDTPVTWRPTTKVIGAKAEIPFLNRYPRAITSLSGKVRVEEHAEATMALYPSRTARPTQVQVADIADQLADGVSAGHVATSTRDILAAPMAMPSYMATVELKLPDGIRDGHYFVGLTVRSKLNPKRVSTYVSTVFLIGILDSAATATTATATTPRLNAIPQPCLPRRSGGRFGAGVPNAVSGTCENGLPLVSSCVKGFLDVNGTYADGCELVRRDLLLTAVCREQWLAINNSRTSYAKLRFAITLTAKPRAPGAGDDVFGLAARKAWKVRFEGVPKGAQAYLIVVDYRGAVQTVSGPVSNSEAKVC
jgi:hypothetical protein